MKCENWSCEKVPEEGERWCAEHRPNPMKDLDAMDEWAKAIAQGFRDSALAKRTEAAEAEVVALRSAHREILAHIFEMVDSRAPDIHAMRAFIKSRIDALPVKP